MNNRSTAYKTELLPGNREISDIGYLNRSLDQMGKNEAIDKLFAEGGDSFYNYFDLIGLIKDPDLVVLSSVHHFYFDNDDLKNVKTVINLKQLNLIKNLDVFLKSIFSIIPHKSNFVGCYLDHNVRNKSTYNNITSRHRGTEISSMVDPYENGITSRVPFINTVYNLVDSKTNMVLTRNNVNTMLSNQGFNVLDMTDINGLTYFHSQKPLALNVISRHFKTVYSF